MGNSVELGYRSGLYVNTGTFSIPVWVEIDLARDVTATDSVDKIDVTTRRTARYGFKANEYGLAEKGWRVEVLIPASGETNTAYETLETARRNRTTVDILHVEGGSISTNGLPATRAICGVFGGEKSEPLSGVATRSYELSFILNSDQSVPQYGTTLNGEFIAAS